MHTAHITSRLASISFAALLTLAMLAGVDTLAGADQAALHMAQATSTAHG